MTARATASYHQDIADRNIEAIVEAAEELRERQGHATISAVAAQAGVSRVTVYAHFPTWDALLEAAVERAVGQTMQAIESASPGDGPPAEALDRMLAEAWQHLARYGAIARAVAELLTPRATARTHPAAPPATH